MRGPSRQTRTVLVLGAGSDIAAATLRALAPRGLGTAILLVREPASVDDLAAELRGHGVVVDVRSFDATQTETHPQLIGEILSRHPVVDLVLLTFGILGDGSSDRGNALRVVQTNFLGAVSMLVPIFDHLAAHGGGSMAILSSVSAERVRRSNFAYGASKAALDAFVQGLADSRRGSGVHVMLVRPGFVRTKMTRHLVPVPLNVGPEDVADAILRGLEARREIVWVPAALRIVMIVLRLLPRAIFRRLAI